jgi:hypothetical protein
MLLFVAECVHDIQVTKTCWHTNEYHTIWDINIRMKFHRSPLVLIDNIQGELRYYI